MEKKKGLGEEKIKSWLNDYQNKNTDPLKSVYEYVYENDEWLIEAYMKTDYSTLCQNDFEKTVRSFVAYKIENGKVEI